MSAFNTQRCSFRCGREVKIIPTVTVLRGPKLEYDNFGASFRNRTSDSSGGVAFDDHKVVNERDHGANRHSDSTWRTRTMMKGESVFVWKDRVRAKAKSEQNFAHPITPWNIFPLPLLSSLVRLLVYSLSFVWTGV